MGCPECGGSGVVMESTVEPGCCGRFRPDGDCCGDPVPEEVLVQAPCPACC
jgi:hypothetical protein